MGLRGLTVLLVVATAGLAQVQPTSSKVPPLIRTLDSIPLHIVENQGMFPEAVQYYVPGKDKTVFFGEDGITFMLREQDRGWAVKFVFLDRSERMRLRAGTPRPAVFSYFQGPKENWTTGLQSYGEITYENLWPGIDLVYRATVGTLKYEFRVKPGADPRQIRLGYHGATAVRTVDDGALRVETPVETFQDAPPIAWTIGADGGKKPVDVAYAVDSVQVAKVATVGFEVGAYDTDRELVIDPAVFVYCGFLGGGMNEKAYGIAVDIQGCAYVVGYFEPSPTFPLRVGPITTLPTGIARYIGFVAKIDSTGKNLLYCGCLGGNIYSFVNAVAVDAAGCAYLVGETASDENSFPVTVGPDLTFNGGLDAFVAKVNATGTGLDYCGYLGGDARDFGRGIAVDASGYVYIAGATESMNGSFPTIVGPDTTANGSGDAYVAKLDPTGTRWVYCGYIGGNSLDEAAGIAVDSKGCAYVAGTTCSDSASFPVAVGPRLTRLPGPIDGFVAKVNATGTALEYCGYFGGADSRYDHLYGIAVDAEGHAYLAGMTGGLEKDLALTVGPYLKRSGPSDAIVAKVLPNGSGLVYCGLIGGTSVEDAHAIAVDAQGNAYVAGYTGSSETSFPVKDAPPGAFQGIADAWVAMIDPWGRTLRYCGYVGGAFNDYATAIAATPSGEVYVAGWTMSGEMSGFPVTVGPDLTHNGSLDAFVARISFHDVVLGGTGRVDSTVTLSLHASDSSGLSYQVGSSLGTGPIPIGNRQIGLSADDLLVVTVGDLWPWVFSGYQGVLDAQGDGQAAIHIPNVQALIGLRIHSAFVTLDPTAPWGIRAISDTESFKITS